MRYLSWPLLFLVACTTVQPYDSSKRIEVQSSFPGNSYYQERSQVNPTEIADDLSQKIDTSEDITYHRVWLYGSYVSAVVGAGLLSFAALSNSQVTQASQAMLLGGVAFLGLGYLSLTISDNHLEKAVEKHNRITRDSNAPFSPGLVWQTSF